MIQLFFKILKYLSEDLISNFDGDFLELIIALTEDTYIYESTFMNEAIEVSFYIFIKFQCFLKLKI